MEKCVTLIYESAIGVNFRHRCKSYPEGGFFIRQEFKLEKIAGRDL